MSKQKAEELMFVLQIERARWYVIEEQCNEKKHVPGAIMALERACATERAMEYVCIAFGLDMDDYNHIEERDMDVARVELMCDHE